MSLSVAVKSLIPIKNPLPPEDSNGFSKVTDLAELTTTGAAEYPSADWKGRW